MNIFKTDYRSNGAVALILRRDDGSEDVITTNLDEGQALCSHELPEGQFFVADYSEHQLLHDDLIRDGIIEHVPGAARVVSGFVALPVCRLTEYGKSLLC